VAELAPVVEAEVPADPAAIKAVMEENHPRFKICYEAALKDDPTLEGRVVIDLSVRKGDVYRAEVKENSIGSDEVAGCIQQMVRGIPFPEGISGDILFPFVFSKPTDEAAAAPKPKRTRAPAKAVPPEPVPESVEAAPPKPTYTAIPTVKGQVEDLRFVSANGSTTRGRGAPLEEGMWKVQYRFEAGGDWLTADARLRIGEGLTDSVTCDAVSFKKCVVRR
jgi:hypothetical protein